MHGGNQDADIMAQTLQQNLIDLAGFGLRANGVRKFAPDHAERGFYVGAPMVVGVEGFLVQGEVGVNRFHIGEPLPVVLDLKGI